MRAEGANTRPGEAAAAPHPARGRCPPAVLALFYFCLSFKPSEPHLTFYLADAKGFTDHQINDRIYPVWTYAYFPLMVAAAAALLAPCSRPPPLKALIVLGAAGRLATRFLLLYGKTLVQMQLMQVAYAAGSVSETVFIAYVYDVTPEPAAFARVTALTQHAFLMSHVLSGVLGDVCLHAFGASVKFLFYLSAAGVAASLVIAVVWFPRPPAPAPGSRAAALRRELRVLRTAAGMPAFAVAVAWWVAVYTVYQFLYGYEASFYKHIRPNASHDWNGSVLSACLSAAAVTVCLPATARGKALLGFGPGASPTAPLRRVPMAVTLLCGVAAAALAAAAWAPWQAALAALVVLFAVFAPLNATMFVLLAHVVNVAGGGQGTGGVGCVPPVDGDGVEQLDEKDTLAVPLMAVGSRRDEIDVDVSGSVNRDGLGAAVNATGPSPSRPYGAVFLAVVAVALALQSAVQYALFTAAEVTTLHTFRLFAAALAVLAVAYGVALAFLPSLRAG